MQKPYLLFLKSVTKIRRNRDNWHGRYFESAGGRLLDTRYRRYTVRENPEAEERDDVDEFILDEDEPFNLQHRNYELGSRDRKSTRLNSSHIL